MDAAVRHRRFAAGALAAAAWLCLASTATPASAQSAPAAGVAPSRPVLSPARGARSQRFVYRAESKRLSEVLQDFAASQNMPAVVGDGVEGVVNASFDTTPQEFLKAVSKAYGILWYNDGSALFFYPARAIQSRLFRLKGYNRKELTDLLASLDLGDKRYPLKFDDAQHTLLVYGPPRHVEMVAAAIDSMDAGAAEGNEKTVRVFPLRFASAADHRMGDVVIPGVTSTLRALYAHGGSEGGGAGEPQPASPLAQKMKALQGLTGNARLVPELPSAMPDNNQGKSQGQVSQRGLRSPVNFDEDQPAFEPDEATNSVIVQGRAYRMREYEALVRRLDQRPVLVELEAMIIDISADNAESLGVDWSVQVPHGSLAVNSPGNTVPLAGGLPGLVAGSTFGLSTVISDAGRQLLARVNALAADGKARVVAKPSVLGIANRTAVMKDKRVATVRVSGNLEANLFQVEAGTLLQVTPQVTSVDGINEIKLSLYIEDGSFEAQVVDQVPVVKKTEIHTEAQVKEGESLLIGGLTVEADTQQEAGVPGLRSIPLVGGLFRWSGSRKTRTERMFLITPRLVGQGPATPVARASGAADIALDGVAQKPRNAAGGNVN
jgi:type III secretion protein C